MWSFIYLVIVIEQITFIGDRLIRLFIYLLVITEFELHKPECTIFDLHICNFVQLHAIEFGKSLIRQLTCVIKTTIFRSFAFTKIDTANSLFQFA